MRRFRSKWIAILATLALLATLLVPMVGPAAAGASSYTTVTKIPTFDPSSAGASAQPTAIIEVKVDPAIATESTAKVEVLTSEGKQLDIKKITFSKLPSTVEYAYADDNTKSASAGEERTHDINAKTFKLFFKPASTAEKASVYFKLVVDAKDCAAGEINANFFSTSGQLDAGKVVVAKAAGGEVRVALVGSVPEISEAGDYVTIRLSQTAGGALKSGNGSVKFKLPAGFKWSEASVTSGAGVNVSIPEDRVLRVDVTGTPEATTDIKVKVSVADTGLAKLGDVKVSTSSDQDTSVSPSELIVATYVDFSVDVRVDGDVKEVIAGRFDAELAKILIKEKVDGSLIPNRKTKIEFPSWVKITDVDVSDSKNITGTEAAFEEAIKANIKGDSNEVEFIIPDGPGKTEFKLKFTVSIKANTSGDIVAKISGRGGVEGQVVVGKALAPVQVTSTAKDIKVGVKNQQVGDIIIKEAKKEAIDAGKLIVELPNGIKWANEPAVEVINGDLDIDEDGIDATDNILTIPIKSTSFVASTIKISGARVDLDRTVPEGVVEASIKGDAVVKNDKSQKGWLFGIEDPKKSDGGFNDDGSADTLDEGEFDQSSAAKVVVANVVTPAPGEQKATATFKVGDAKFTVNGKEQTMDVAPYVKNGRTYLPVRYVAMALGVAPENIFYADGVVTLLKGGIAVQLTIGSNVLKVNGAEIKMDVAAELSNGRTMLPFRWVAQALGATVSWDEATQTVSMTL